MPRNGSGVASIVNTFTPLTTANANDVNDNFTDVATMITDSLPRDGQAGMSGQFLATSGTAGEPGISWNADPDTGIRRPSGDQQAVVCGGLDVATFSTTSGTFNVDLTTRNITLGTDKAISFAGTGAATTRANLGAVATTRSIAAGSGLTGGGDLSADRTLSVVPDIGIGAGQTWQAPSRAVNTIYQNTTGRPIMIAGAWGSGSGTLQVSADSSTWITITASSGNSLTSWSAIVPKDWYYRINGSVPVSNWNELRT